MIARGIFKSADDLSAELMRYIRNHNLTARPRAALAAVVEHHTFACSNLVELRARVELVQVAAE